MEYLTVKEYAERENIGLTAAYKRINTNKVETKVIKNIKHVVYNNTDEIVEESKKQIKNIKQDKPQIEINDNYVLALKDQIAEKEKRIDELIEDKKFLKERIEDLSQKLAQALDIQERSIEEKQQTNTLLGHLQKALGFLEKKEEYTHPINKSQGFSFSPVEVEEVQNNDVKKNKTFEKEG